MQIKFTMENDLIQEFREKSDSFDWFSKDLRLNYQWNDIKFIEMMNLIDKIFSFYKNKDVFPKDLVYFFTSEIPFIIGIVENPIFLRSIPSGFTKESYLSLVENRKKELLELREYFFYDDF